MRTRTLVATVAIAGLVVVGADVTAYAATGSDLILGHLNSATKTTNMSNTGTGPVLRLHAKHANQAALAVNTKARVVNLNADTVDGRSAASLVNPTKLFIDSDTSTDHPSSVAYPLTLAPGTYELGFTAGMVPDTGSATAPNPSECLILSGTNIVASDMSTYLGGYVPLISASTVYRVTPTSQIEVICGSQNSGFRFYAPLRITATSMQGLATAGVSPAATRPGALVAGH